MEWYIDRGKPKNLEKKTCTSATSSTTNLTWIYPGANQGLRGERPATNDMSHGTALISSVTQLVCHNILNSNAFQHI
jgi:hypothetical protein